MSVEESLEAIKKQLEDHEKRISKLEAQPQTKETIVTKPLSVREFILSKKPKSNIQKTLVVGYYLEKYEGLDSFNVKDLEDGFRAAKETVPPNVNFDAIKNIEKGYFAEAKEKKDNRKAWYLTNSGEDFVNTGTVEKK